jgi:hypothetical protein
MLTLRKASVAIAVVLAGCAQIEVRNADVGPGGAVTTYDANKQAWLGWIPQVGVVNKAPGIDHWRRIRVIAPEGATECRSGAVFARGGPEDEGKPNANREVMLTSNQNQNTAHFECDTPGGVVRRSVKASVYTIPIPPNVPADQMWLYEGNRGTKVLPPLVHMDPKDAQAEARWAALGAEVCPVISDRASPVTGFVCLPGMLEKFKVTDLGEGS